MDKMAVVLDGSPAIPGFHHGSSSARLSPLAGRFFFNGGSPRLRSEPIAARLG